MAESETSALGGARDESTDELHGREEPTPCVEDDAEEEAERVESREMMQARKGPTPGIVYLSRIPPFMKPLKVRHLLSQHGEVGRVFLQPEGVCTSTHAHSESVAVHVHVPTGMARPRLSFHFFCSILRNKSNSVMGRCLA